MKSSYVKILQSGWLRSDHVTQNFILKFPINTSFQIHVSFFINIIQRQPSYTSIKERKKITITYEIESITEYV